MVAMTLKAKCVINTEAAVTAVTTNAAALKPIMSKIKAT
jgi:hypothetical protein